MQEVFVVRGKPGETQAGKTVGLADRTEADGAIVKVAGRGKTRSGVVLEFAVDFIGKDVDAMLRGEIENATEDLRSHVQPGGIVGRVDVDRAGVRADEGLESGEIVGPTIFGFAPPFAHGSASTFGNGKCAFVARRFDDRVVLRRE